MGAVAGASRLMDQFDRHSRQRVMEQIAREEASGYGPAMRQRGIAVGLAAIMLILGAFAISGSDAISLVDVVVVGFIAVSCVILVALWRRGSEERRGFFVGGVVVALAGLSLAVILAQWEASRVSQPSPSLVRDSGVSFVFPGVAEVRATEPAADADLYPDPGTASPWRPLMRAVGGGRDCAVIDATAYADARRYWDLDEAVAAELEGIEENRPDSLLASLSESLTAGSSAGLDVEILHLDGPVASVELEYDDASSRRLFLLTREGRWVALSCFAGSPEAVPTRRWADVAGSVNVSPARDHGVAPGVLASFGGSIPFSDCRRRDHFNAGGAAAVITCEAGGTIDVTYLQYDSLWRIRQWWATESKDVPKVTLARAAERCRHGQSAQAADIDGRFLCRIVGTQARVSWVDVSELRAAFATSSSLPLDALYARWAADDLGSGPSLPRWTCPEAWCQPSR